MGGQGILFHKKDYEVLAEVVDMLVRDAPLRERIISRQRQWAQSFLEPHVRNKWQVALMR